MLNRFCNHILLFAILCTLPLALQPGFAAAESETAPHMPSATIDVEWDPSVLLLQGFSAVVRQTWAHSRTPPWTRFPPPPSTWATAFDRLCRHCVSTPQLTSGTGSLHSLQPAPHVSLQFGPYPGRQPELLVTTLGVEAEPAPHGP